MFCVFVKKIVQFPLVLEVAALNFNSPFFSYSHYFRNGLESYAARVLPLVYSHLLLKYKIAFLYVGILYSASGPHIIDFMTEAAGQFPGVNFGHACCIGI